MNSSNIHFILDSDSSTFHWRPLKKNHLMSSELYKMIPNSILLCANINNMKFVTAKIVHTKEILFIKQKLKCHKNKKGKFYLKTC